MPALIYSTPPSLPSYRRPFLFFVVMTLAGFTVTVISCLVLILLFPPLLLIRAVFILKERFTKGESVRGRYCDVWWPCPNEFRRAVLFLKKSVTPSSLASLLSARESSSCCAAPPPPVDTDLVSTWNQRTRPMTRLEDLESYVNEGEWPTAPSVTLVPDFCSVDEEGCPMRCSLAFLSIDPSYYPYCIFRFISSLSNGNITFDLEPRVLDPFSSPYSPFHMAFYILGRVYRFFQFVFFGPLSLLLQSYRSPNAVWALLENAPKRNNLRRGSGEERFPPLAPVRHVSCISIEHMDMLQRAERLLRAATVELVTSFVAGALRRCLREQGITHPPDVGGTMPVCTGGSLADCRSVLLPISIPTSVEGAIPRIWAVQRRLSNVVEGVLPMAYSASRSIGDVLLSPQWNQMLNSSLYGDDAVQVSFFRMNGDVLLDGNAVAGLQVLPPASTRAAFCFIRTNSQLLLCSSLDVSLFPFPQRILASFQAEVNGLLEHLSMRLLTLTQATILPERVPSFQDDYVQVSPIEEHHTLDELQELLTNVQTELDGMRANPQGERSEYIRKLTELEEQMERFHGRIASELGVEVAACVHEDTLQARSVVAELLAPYRNDTVGGRRFSREFLRTDSVRKCST